MSKKLTAEQEIVFSALADDLGRLLAEVSPKNQRIEQIKDLLKKQHGEGRIKGTLFEVVISVQETTRIIADLVRKLLSEKRLKKVQRTSSTLECTVHAITDQPAK